MKRGEAVAAFFDIFVHNLVFPARRRRAVALLEARMEWGQLIFPTEWAKAETGTWKRSQSPVDTLEHRDTYGKAQVSGCSKGHQGRSEFFLINQIQPSQSDFFYISQNSGSS